MSGEPSKFSLSFCKKIENKSLKSSALQNEIQQDLQTNKHLISSFDKNAKRPEITKPEDYMTIPLVPSKRDDIFKRLLQKSKAKKEDQTVTALTENGALSLDEQAAAAVLEDSRRKLDEIRERTEASNLSINLLSTENALNSSESFQATGSVSTLDDYDQMNVEVFGKALLRGMGWSKGKGIGKNNKKVIEIVNPTSKGFALTSTEGNKTKDTSNENEEEMELKKGSLVLIHNGRNRGTYGQVESLDEDHLLVRTSRGDKVLRDVEQNIQVVSSKEYKDLSRVINKEMYDEFKAAEERKKEKRKESKEDSSTRNTHKKIKQEKNEDKKQNEVQKDRCSGQIKDENKKNSDRHLPERRDSNNQDRKNNYYLDDKDKSKSKKDDRDRKKDTKDKESDRHRLSSKQSIKDTSSKYSEITKDKKRDENTRKDGQQKYIRHVSDYPKTQTSSSLPVIPWARENLRVRIIDKDYKGGKYHKAKVIVLSIDTVNSCTCICEDGKILYDINPNHLETVIPKTQPAIVLIVNGEHKGQRGKVLELNKEKEKASIQLVQEASIILNLYYDDICEYVTR